MADRKTTRRRTRKQEPAHPPPEEAPKEAEALQETSGWPEDDPGDQDGPAPELPPTEINFFGGYRTVDGDVAKCHIKVYAPADQVISSFAEITAELDAYENWVPDTSHKPQPRTNGSGRAPAAEQSERPRRRRRAEDDQDGDWGERRESTIKPALKGNAAQDERTGEYYCTEHDVTLTDYDQRGPTGARGKGCKTDLGYDDEQGRAVYCPSQVWWNPPRSRDRR